MKTKIIGIVCGIAVVGMGVFGIIQLNNEHRYISILLLSLSLVPMYFLYSALVLGKYKDRKNTPDKYVHLDELIKGKNKLKDMYTEDKVKNGYGKVLEFPKGKLKNKDNKK